MKNQWTNFYTGFVKVKAYGKGTERLINGLMRQGAHIWDIERTEPDVLVFFIDVKEIGTLRRVVRKSDCKVKLMYGRGGPFLLKRALKNGGFLVGILAFLLCVFVLSNMVWGIEIEGAKPDTEHTIRKELDAMGVKIGKVQFFLDDVEDIQRHLSDKIEVLTWIGVDLKGTTYHFRVVEKEQPEEVEILSSQNLIAKKKAIITKMQVKKGQPVVGIHDYVQKGQLLVSGTIGKEGYSEIVPASGVIMGETWYKASVEVPIKTTFSVYDGDEYIKHYIGLGQLDLPIWGFKDPGYSSSESEVRKKPFRFLQWELPISYKTVTKRSKEEFVRRYTKEEAVIEGKKMAKNDLEKRLSEESEIIGEKVLHETIENGKVKLSIHYQVIENIAIGQPIIQGD